MPKKRGPKKRGRDGAAAGAKKKRKVRHLGVV